MGKILLIIDSSNKYTVIVSFNQLGTPIVNVNLNPCTDYIIIY